MAKKNKEDLDFLVPWCGDRVPWEPWESQKTYSHYNEETDEWEDRPIDWRENKPFKAAFKAVKFTGSTSSTRILMEDVATGAEFVIREDDFFEALSQMTPLFGVFIGEWIFRKTANKYYGLKLHN